MAPMVMWQLSSKLVPKPHHEDGVNESALRAAAGATGCEVKAVSKEPHVKRGLFHR